MARCFVLVVLLASVVRAQDNTTTTLGKLALDQNGLSFQQLSAAVCKNVVNKVHDKVKEHNATLQRLPLSQEIEEYLYTIAINIIFEFSSAVDNVIVHSITEDLNSHCAEFLEPAVEDLTVVPSTNVSCVFLRLRSTLSLMLEKAIKKGAKNVSRDCSQRLLRLCSVVPANCTLAYQERFGEQVLTHVTDLVESIQGDLSTPLRLISGYVTMAATVSSLSYGLARNTLLLKSILISRLQSIEPFSYLNLVGARTRDEIKELIKRKKLTFQTEERLTWGIVRSRAGAKNNTCLRVKQVDERHSEEYSRFFYCKEMGIFHLIVDLLRCAYTDTNSKPLTWSTVHSAYFHSQCLCLAFQGTRCGVRPPQGVDRHFYCFSVLLRDFQRHVSYRPAVTYLDYAFKTRVPICKFANFIQIVFRETCESSGARPSFLVIQSVQCYFQNLVDKSLNCSESLQVNTYNASVLCDLKFFMQYVFCDGDDDDDDLGASVRYYAPGDSPVVQVLTFLDVSVRVLTLTTYLACPQLRNLPGKLLIGYQVTALLRLVMVRASLGDLALAVRLDVASDLASTLWLTAYLHFLTSSIRKLRLPDSLTTGEALVVLLRYSLFGWVLPAALSAAFFFMDEVLDSSVQFGQLLFVLCNYVALLANVYIVFLFFLC